MATFERRPELYEYNHYISDYLWSPKKVEKFDNSKNTTITYQDAFGNEKTNVGPVIGTDKQNQPNQPNQQN